MHYFDNLTDALEVHILQDWTTCEQVLPISFQKFDFNSKLLEAPKTLKDFVYQYKQNKEILDKCENQNNVISKQSFFNSYIIDIFLFIAAILPVIAMAAIVHIMCKHAKLKASVTGIAFQPIKGTDVIFGSINNSKYYTCKAQWYMIGALTLIITGLVFFILAATWKCRISRGHLFPNAVMVMLFFSDVEHYVPVKLCKTAGSIHSFKIIGHLTPAQMTLERRFLWDVVQIDWKEVLMTLNGNMVCLPISVILLMRDKIKLKCIIRKRT